MAILRKFKKGFPIFREGEHSREMYFIQAGTVRIYRSDKNEQIELAQLPKGALFGEMALIDGKPRSATAQAQEDCELLVIPFYEFQKHVGPVPDWFMSLIKVASQRLRKANERLNSGKRLQIISNVAQLIVLIMRKHEKTVEKENSTPKPLDLKMVRKTLMEVLGINKEPMLEAMSYLEKRDLITTISNTLSLNNPEELLSFSEFLREPKLLEEGPGLDDDIFKNLMKLKFLLDDQLNQSNLVTFSISQIQNELLKNMELAENQLDWFLSTCQRLKVAKFYKEGQKETENFSEVTSTGQIQFNSKILNKSLQTEKFRRMELL